MSSVSGGLSNIAEAEGSAVLGGQGNTAKRGRYSVVGGGKGLVEETEWGFVS